MSHLKKRRISCSRSLAAAALVIASLSCPLSASEGDDAPEPFDWVVQIKTQPLKKQFSFKDATFKEMTRAQVSYYPVGKKDSVTKYEDLWFNQSRLIGLNRHTKLGVTEGEGVGIKVVHNNSAPTDNEYWAASSAIACLLLDTYLNGNQLVQVWVPAGSFQPICTRLENKYKFKAEGAENPILQLFICAEGSDESKTLAYEGQ